MACSCCYEDFLSNCNSEIEINAGLDADTEYRYWVRDKFDHIYEGRQATDVNGVLRIPVTDFPNGFFNHHAGQYTLQLFSGPYEIQANLSIKNIYGSTSIYDCILFWVQGGTLVKNNLGW